MPCSGKRRDTGCPITFALDMFGDRWSLLIIRDLMLKGSKAYGDFLEAPEGIATNILADRLKYLESMGIIRKSCDPGHRRRYLYSLTAKGGDLAPIIVEMICWAGKHDPHTKVPDKTLEEIENDRKGFAAEIRARLT